MGLIISLVSFLIGFLVIFIFSFYKYNGFGAAMSFIILAILGAPLTFLQRFFWVFGDKSEVPLYAMYFLYFLQYQLLAFSIYKFSDKMNLKLYVIIVTIIIVSAIIMYCFKTGKFE